MSIERLANMNNNVPEDSLFL